MFKKLFGKQRGSGNNIPLDKIAMIIESGAANVKRNKKGIIFQSNLGTTSVSIAPKNVQCTDGSEISDVITIKTNLPKEFNLLDDEKIAVLNMLATFSALIKDETSGETFIASRLSVFKDDEDSWRLYVPLIGFSAIFQADSVRNNINYSFGKQQISENDRLPESDEPSRWGKDEFEHAKTVFDNMGMLANTDHDGMTVEFPWEPEGVSAVMGHKTSLLMIKANEPSPLWGNGIFFKLELPLQFEKVEVARLSNRFNLAELNATDAPPFFGAWCNVQNRRLAFVGFWPNFLYQPGTALNIAVWMMHRSQISKTIIGRI